MLFIIGIFTQGRSLSHIKKHDENCVHRLFYSYFSHSTVKLVMLYCVEAEEAYCGNKIVEEGEQCDCGFAEDCRKDDCCIGRNEADVKASAFCTRTPSAQCRYDSCC